MDHINNEIIQFASYLFNNWLDDYKLHAEKMKDMNFTHHKWDMNEGVEKNIKDSCLPLDYFMERVLQVGLISSMPGLKQMIEIMLQFDNVGFTQKGPSSSTQGLSKTEAIQSLIE